MKKRYYLAIAILACAIQLSGQDKPFSFGMRIGGSIDWMNPDAKNYDSDGITAGFTWGFIAEYGLMENYALQTGFNVQYLGGKLKYPAKVYVQSTADTLTGDLQRTYHLQYLQIPITFKMQTEVKDNLRLFGRIGIGTGFRLRAKADDYMEASGGGTYEEDKINVKDDITFIRESFMIGGGANITLKGSTCMIIELTYDGCLFNIMKGENSMDPSIEQKGKANFIELGVGVLF